MKKWKTTIIKPDATIRQTIEIIDRSALQIALIVDETNRLVGTVTDGDVRRGILRNISLDAPVDRIMNAHPIVASHLESNRRLLEILREKSLRHIPIVDAGGKLVGLQVLDDLLKPAEKPNLVVLMAGGLGSRLRPLTDNCPKPLLEIGGKPILEIILTNLVEFGFKNFFFSVNYKAEMIEQHFGDGSRWNANISYLHESEPLGTAGSLTLLPKKPTAPVLLMNGDVLTKVNFDYLLRFHSEQAPAVTMCVREYDFQVPYGVTAIADDQVTGIDEKPVHRFFVNAGIYLLNPEALDSLEANSRIDMTSLIRDLIAKGHKISAFPIREYWLDIGQAGDFERAQGDVKEVFHD